MLNIPTIYTPPLEGYLTRSWPPACHVLEIAANWRVNSGGGGVGISWQHSSEQFLPIVQLMNEVLSDSGVDAMDMPASACAVRARAWRSARCVAANTTRTAPTANAACPSTTIHHGNAPPTTTRTNASVSAFGVNQRWKWFSPCGSCNFTRITAPYFLFSWLSMAYVAPTLFQRSDFFLSCSEVFC